MGKLFVIEGSDGSGKHTQLEKLKEHLKKDNIHFKDISFPNYGSASSSLVKMYLGGEFGTNPNDISAYIASTFYAADRYATYKKDLEDYYNHGGIILADRYTTANMIHQAGKIKNKQERKKFLEWLYDFEFNLYKIPKPDEVFFLNMPREKSLKLMENRKKKITNEEQKDIHERNENYMRESYEAAKEVAKEYNWYVINCVKNDAIRTIEDIHQEIYKEIRRHI